MDPLYVDRGEKIQFWPDLTIILQALEQIQQLAAPHLSYRHTDKASLSKRKQARTASHLGALSDLRKHGLAENGGQISGGDTLRHLTPMGLKAASYATGVALPATGTWPNPGKGGAQADIVITSSEDGVPLLFVFNRVGPRNPSTVIAQLAELTQRHWQGTAHDGFHLYDGKLPIVVTGMKQLQEHGPAGAIFRHFGRPHNQTLLEAIGNPRREAQDARRRAEYAARERAYKEQLRRAADQQRAEREARRPVCADWGTRFTDARWKALEPAGWDAPRETHSQAQDVRRCIHPGKRLWLLDPARCHRSAPGLTVVRRPGHLRPDPSSEPGRSARVVHGLARSKVYESGRLVNAGLRPGKWCRGSHLIRAFAPASE
ncbi:hypothetical protein [Streptomyces sp. NPDC050388]|uniref:hypothetical protein n=1 Tax=Streptomyces sp. NPDC050388 TaxID=3155781 RepID=UPI00343E5566